MALSPDIEARGMKAYEQARAFERLRTWRLPLTFIIFALIPALTGAYMWATGHQFMAWLNFIAAILLSWMGRFQWKQLVARHARNLRLLAELKAEHGDALPWIQVENHFAELERIKRELAEERTARK
jgi:signal transduction histidine kinase